MINAFVCRGADLSDRFFQRRFRRCLILRLDRRLNLLDRSLDAGLYGFVSLRFLLGNKDSFLCRFDIRQLLHLPPHKLTHDREGVRHA